MSIGGLDRVELALRGQSWGLATRGTENLPHPFGDRDMLLGGDGLDLRPLGLIHQNL
ncbi:MAG: hypothetical protein U0470_11745 [Anaerolineae bacterium]